MGSVLIYPGLFLLEVSLFFKTLRTPLIKKMSGSPSETAMLPLELTLVLAATRDMGIGLRGTLPWTGLKKEMAYFARVTKRLPPSVSRAFSHTYYQ